jgi:hypothetical protein
LLIADIEMAFEDCPLSRVKRTSQIEAAMFVYDPEQLSLIGRILRWRRCDAEIGNQKAVPIREAALASLKAPLRPVPAPVDPTDASEEREASGR